MTPVLRELILLSPTHLAFEGRDDGEGGVVYRKELVYPGHFIKKDSKGNVEFELPVTDNLMEHWVATFQRMKQNGVEVPLPIEHTSDPEQRRGTVVDLKVEPSEIRKGNALFAYVKFRDKETGDALSKTAQVSLYSPPDFIDGRGNRYIRPIRHVALTDYPLIPGLDKFEAIAASLVLSEGSSMSMKEMADRLGVEVPDGATDEEIAQAIEDAWNSDDVEMDGDEFAPTTTGDIEADDDFAPTTTSMDDLDDLGMDDLDDEFAPTTTGMGDEFSASGGKSGYSFYDETAKSDATKFAQQAKQQGAKSARVVRVDDEQYSVVVQGGDDHKLDRLSQRFNGEPDPEAAMSHRANNRPRRIAASIVNHIADARETKLQKLVDDRKITPAVRKALERKYCGQKAVSFALSHEAVGGRGDDFDDVIHALSLNKPVFSLGERTGPQLRGRDGGDGGGSDDAVQRDAERRSKEAARQRARR